MAATTLQRITLADKVGGPCREAVSTNRADSANPRRPHYSTKLGGGKSVRKYVEVAGSICKARRRGLLRSWTGSGHRWGSGVMACRPTPRSTGYVVQRAVSRFAQAATPPKASPKPAVALILLSIYISQPPIRSQRRWRGPGPGPTPDPPRTHPRARREKEKCIDCRNSLSL
jgi:hypothetical protein